MANINKTTAISMTTYSHLIAVDPESGSLWGGVEIAMGVAGLRADVVRNVSPTGMMESNDDGNPVPVTGEMLADRCTVYRVVLGNDTDEAPEGAPLAAQMVYSGSEMGWLPNDAAAAWGEKM